MTNETAPKPKEPEKKPGKKEKKPEEELVNKTR
jgi:hypothetical protein